MLLLVAMCIKVVGPLLSGSYFAELVFGSCPFFWVTTFDVSASMIGSVNCRPRKFLIQWIIFESIVQFIGQWPMRFVVFVQATCKTKEFIIFLDGKKVNWMTEQLEIKEKPEDLPITATIKASKTITKSFMMIKINTDLCSHRYGLFKYSLSANRFQLFCSDLTISYNGDFFFTWYGMGTFIWCRHADWLIESLFWFDWILLWFLSRALISGFTELFFPNQDTSNNWLQVCSNVIDLSLYYYEFFMSFRIFHFERKKIIFLWLGLRVASMPNDQVKIINQMMNSMQIAIPNQWIRFSRLRTNSLSTLNIF